MRCWHSSSMRREIGSQRVAINFAFLCLLFLTSTSLVTAGMYAVSALVCPRQPLIRTARYDNTTARESGDHTLSSQTARIADFVRQGLGGQVEVTTSNVLPNLDSNPLPSTGVLPNASWSYTTLAASTYRPDSPISWSSDMPKAAKCWSDIVTWRSSSVSWWNANYGDRSISGPVMATTSYSTFNTTTTTTIYPSSVSAYTLCDGSPRVDASPVTKTLTTNVTSPRTFSQIANVTALPDWSVPPPCEPDPDTCRLWYYHSNILEINEDELLSRCGRPTNTNESCVIQGGPIELIYWPVPPKEDLCEDNATSISGQPIFAHNSTLHPKIPETITTLGHTFTSGTVYLSFSTLYASWDGFWNHVGPDFSDFIVPLPSSSLFSQCGGARSARNHGTPLNYADLNWPVPASAYSCQARCDPVGEPICPQCDHTAVPSTGECGTIWSDVNPNLAMPTEIRELVPEWSTCLMYNDRIPNFWFDPPIALTGADHIAGPTTPHAEPTAEPAAPSSTPHSAVPVETKTTDTEPKVTSTGAPPEKQSPNAPVYTSVTSAAAATTIPDSDTTDKPNDHLPASPLVSSHAGSSDGNGPVSPDVDPHAESLEEQPPSTDNADDPTAISTASGPQPLTSSKWPKFTYDPIGSTTEHIPQEEPAVITSAPLDALSVLSSALVQLTSTAPPHTAVNEHSRITVELSSKTYLFPAPSQQSELQSPSPDLEQPTTRPDRASTLLTDPNNDATLSLGPSGTYLIAPSLTTHLSSPNFPTASLPDPTTRDSASEGKTTTASHPHEITSTTTSPPHSDSKYSLPPVLASPPNPTNHPNTTTSTNPQSPHNSTTEISPSSADATSSNADHTSSPSDNGLPGVVLESSAADSSSSGGAGATGGTDVLESGGERVMSGVRVGKAVVFVGLGISVLVGPGW